MTTVLLTITADGTITSRETNIAPRKADVLKYLGISELGKMDALREEVRGDKFVVTVSIAQDKPWTWINYVFVG